MNDDEFEAMSDQEIQNLAKLTAHIHWGMARLIQKGRLTHERWKSLVGQEAEVLASLSEQEALERVENFADDAMSEYPDETTEEMFGFN
jgi:hypothetical protein